MWEFDVCNDKYTSLDIVFVEGVISRYMPNLNKKHWEVVKGIMRYLHHIENVCICFGKRDSCVEGYMNVDYARDVDKRRPTSSYVFMFN